jgi:hypothetical protein
VGRLSTEQAKLLDEAVQGEGGLFHPLDAR